MYKLKESVKKFPFQFDFGNHGAKTYGVARVNQTPNAAVRIVYDLETISVFKLNFNETVNNQL
ncbi:MAG TPA: hypothetical protein DD416_05925 [Rhodobacteraceae bacterium]|nr:hypothetical protein [Paracoccaceae bacterium]